MPHTLADALFDHLIEVFPPDQAYGLSAFEREEMPRPVAHFLNIALQHGLGVEADAFLEVRSSWFDYEHPDVQEAFDLFIGVLGDHALVPASAWSETLAQAVAEVTDYLVRPVETLVGFIFGQKEALPAYTVFSRFEYFAPYSYLHDVASAYAEEKKLSEIDRVRFRSLLKKVDRQMTSDLDAAGWLDLLDPLYRLAERVPGQAGVSTDLLYDFFEGKDAEAVLERLEAEHSSNEARPLSRRELQRLLEDALPSSVSRSSAPVAPPPETSRDPGDQPVPLWMQFQRHEHQRREAATLPPPPPPPVAPEPEKEPAPAVPLWMRFQQQSGRNAPPPQPPPPATLQAPEPRPTAGPPRYATLAPPPLATSAPKPSPPETPPESPPPDPEPASVPVPPPPQEASPPPPEPPRVATPPPPPEPEDELMALERIVLGAFEQEQREQYIERLFGGSHEAYEETLRQLEAAPSWQQASSIIAQEVFRKHQVNIYSRPAVAFTNAVEARFDEETFTEDR